MTYDQLVVSEVPDPGLERLCGKALFLLLSHDLEEEFQLALVELQQVVWAGVVEAVIGCPRLRVAEDQPAGRSSEHLVGRRVGPFPVAYSDDIEVTVN